MDHRPPEEGKRLDTSSEGGSGWGGAENLCDGQSPQNPVHLYLPFSDSPSRRIGILEREAKTD